MALLTPDALANVASMELRARLIVEGFLTGLHRSPFHGFSVEFAEHRAYAPGDELRHVDWKAYGRNDRLVVKRYEEETNLRQTVVLDTSASMRYAGAAGVTKLTVAATLAAALHALMVRQRDATGLVAFDRAVNQHLRPSATRAHLATLFATLDRLTTDPPPAATETGVAAALHDVAERIPRRGLVVVLSDLFDASGDVRETVRALQHLRHRGHEVIVFHVLDAATERRFDLPDAPVRLRDLETGEERTVLPGQIRAEVSAAAEAFVAELQRRCREARIDYVPIDTAAPYADALRAYLAKRRRLF